MFTGIVQTKARVQQIQDDNAFRRLTLTVDARFLAELERGASIAINGVCLTVTEFDVKAQTACFDVIDETLRRTNLGSLQIGEAVNFERSLRFGSELGGHIVSGHIQAVATISQLEKSAKNCAMQLKLTADAMRYILSKGFVAVDGCSLTVGETETDSFWLHLIPETLNVTTLGSRQKGDRLNIEFDQQTVTIVDTVARILAKQQLSG